MLGEYNEYILNDLTGSPAFNTLKKYFICVFD